MNNSLLMQVLNGFQNLSDNLSSSGFGVRSVFVPLHNLFKFSWEVDNLVKKLSARNVGHNNIHIFVVFKNIQQRNDIRMI